MYDSFYLFLFITFHKYPNLASLIKKEKNNFEILLFYETHILENLTSELHGGSVKPPYPLRLGMRF